ncbi:MAG: AbrB/MazE/SpoVT family DNA-binding domain-containing protein [Blastocatellia bacterium]
MKAQIIQIGNSQGIRIPKTLLEETKIEGEVELEACPDGILIRNIRAPRNDWDAVFKSLAEGEDDMAVDSSSTVFEKKGWQW